MVPRCDINHKMMEQYPCTMRQPPRAPPLTFPCSEPLYILRPVRVGVDKDPSASSSTPTDLPSPSPIRPAVSSTSTTSAPRPPPPLAFPPPPPPPPPFFLPFPPPPPPPRPSSLSHCLGLEPSDCARPLFFLPLVGLGDTGCTPPTAAPVPVPAPSPGPRPAFVRRP